MNMRLRITGLFLCLIASLCIVAPLSFAFAAENEGDVVRVGWFESSFNATDDAGRRSGYAYEYLQKIAAYTGWTYEYVEGSWPELLQMLEAGEIDLLSEVSYTDDRANTMLFSSLPMGTEEYCAFAAADNTQIKPDDYSTLNGKRVGVIKNSVMEKYFVDWEQAHGVDAVIVELTGTDSEAWQMLRNGEIDVYVTPVAFEDPGADLPLFEIGSSDFFFSVNKARPDLLSELDYAMNAIQGEDRYYNQQMLEKYVWSSGTNASLTSSEASWLAAHGPIRVGYLENYLPFCAKDEATGELTGALKGYLELASTCMNNAEISFEAKAYPSTAAALEALESGEVDCIFPIDLSAYDGEQSGLAATTPFMQTEMFAVARTIDQKSLSLRGDATVALSLDDPDFGSFLKDHFPNWQAVYFDTTEECFSSVAAGAQDCVLISNYQINATADLRQERKLVTLATGETASFSFAVQRGESNLYSILNKVANNISASKVNSALADYSIVEEKVSFAKFIRDNLAMAIAVVAVLASIILILLLRASRAERKAVEGQRLISVAERDHLTGLYSRNFFLEYANQIHRDHPERHMDAIAVNIEQFHLVNALNGRRFGDKVLRLIGDEVRSFLEETEGIASRVEGDRFDIFCEHQDDYQALLDRFQGKLDGLSKNASVRLRMGVMPWQEGVEPIMLFDRAWTACNMVRGDFKEHLKIYNEDMRKRELLNQQLLNDLCRAVDEREFKVYYQPKYDIRCDPPKLYSAEALIRWQHPDLGMVPPEDFVPLFERNGKIGVIDNYVWEEAAQQTAAWRDKYGVVLPISVNLSRADLFDPALESTLDRVVEKNGLDRGVLKLEVTESAYTENAEQLVQVIERLREKGYEVEMDDFGTGYSSLNMLSSMPIDVLKLDMAFIRNIEHDERDYHLVELVLNIAKNLELAVIAEGVETENQMELLRNAGCDLVQGFYFSHPLPPEEFEELIARSQGDAGSAAK